MADGTAANPLPNDTNKIEPKVKWGAIASYLVGLFGLALWQALTNDDNALLIEMLPDMVEMFILPIVPVIGQLIVAYNVRHQWRRGEVVPSSNTTELG